MKKLLYVLLAVAIAASPVFANGSKDSKDAKAAGGKGIVIRIASVADKLPSHLANLKFKEIVDSKLPGKYDIQVYGNNQLGDDVRATEAVRMGNVEMVTTSSSPLVGLVPQFMVLDLPFIFTSEKAADAVCDGEVGKKLAAGLESKGLKLFAYYENGFRNLTNSNREVKSPADLKGLKIRTMENPMHLAAWKALGANPTPMPFSELFTAMQQKTIDGQENPIPTIYLNKFNEVQKYVTITGHVWGPHVLLMNKKFFDSIPAADQKVLLDAAREAELWQRATNRKMKDDYIDELKKAGMTVTFLTPEQQKAFQDAVAPVYTQFEDKIGKDFIAEVKSIVAKNN